MRSHGVGYDVAPSLAQIAHSLSWLTRPHGVGNDVAPAPVTIAYPSPPPSSPVTRCFPMFSAIRCHLPSSPTVLCRHSPSFLMTAIFQVHRLELTVFCRPVRSFSKVARQAGKKDADGPHPAIPSRSRFFGVPPPGTIGAPHGCQQWVGKMESLDKERQRSYQGSLSI